MKKDLNFEELMGSINTQASAQAYPLAHDPLQNHVTGLSKLEVFTCAALQGLCASSTARPGSEYATLNISTDAVKIARATIDQLNRGNK